MTIQERLEDTETALHIAQVDGDKWKARAIKLAEILGIRDSDIDDFDLNNATNGEVIKALFPDARVDDYDYGKDPVIDVYGIDDTEYITVRKNWWNSLYKKEGDKK